MIEMITWTEKTPSTCGHIRNLLCTIDSVGSDLSRWNRPHLHVSLFFYNRVEYYYKKNGYVYVVFSGYCGSVIRYRNPYREYLVKLKEDLKILEKLTREVEDLSPDQVLLYRNARNAQIRVVVRNLREIFGQK